MRRRIYEVLDVGRTGDWLSQVADVVLILLIVSNVATLVVSTDHSIYNAAPRFFLWFEGISFGIFTVEYALRLWSCTANPRYAHPVNGRLQFALRPLMITDAMAVLSYFLILLLPPEIGVNLVALRALRLVSRTARLTRYSPGLQALAYALTSRKNELLAVVSIVVVLLLLASSLMYFAEQSAQPNEFSSIPAAMWWGIITVTTVGYGDVSPVTPLGRLLAGVIALLGIGIFALPAGILGSGFMEQVNQRRNPPVVRICPHCGEVIDESSQQE